MDASQSHSLTWRDGDVPVSDLFDDPFYSLEDGWAESTHVFLDGNDLPARLRDGFHIAELGFGTGLNLALVMSRWGGPGVIRYTSFEAFPLSAAAATRALSAVPEALPFAAHVAELLDMPGRVLRSDHLIASIVPGDARQTLPGWDGCADAWFLDGFSPARNPELWGPDLMAEVAYHTALGGTFATYTAAGHVRRALEAAGFEVSRTPGYGRKRHMSRGVLR